METSLTHLITQRIGFLERVTLCPGLDAQAWNYCSTLITKKYLAKDYYSQEPFFFSYLSALFESPRPHQGHSRTTCQTIGRIGFILLQDAFCSDCSRSLARSLSPARIDCFLARLFGRIVERWTERGPMRLSCLHLIIRSQGHFTPHHQLNYPHYPQSQSQYQ